MSDEFSSKIIFLRKIVHDIMLLLKYLLHIFPIRTLILNYSAINFRRNINVHRSLVYKISLKIISLKIKTIKLYNVVICKILEYKSIRI